AKEYPEQRITVSRDMVELTDKALSRHYAEKETVNKVLSRVFRAQYLKQPFQRPVPGRVSGIFGTRRFYNDQPRSPHKGVDFKARAGQRVRCFSGGRVVLTGEHYFAGKSVYVDHGQGVVSIYCHLSKILVNKGREIKKGDVVGLVGMTGRATGPHLHFGLSVLGQAVDPLPFLQ
ncbi:MAG: M23 family metallopeptidase, partial [Thermodesulfobacteriota bacterium]|nr:M23 family metallopeptidase [Thermodesulfobacteriota bacterium]